MSSKSPEITVLPIYQLSCDSLPSFSFNEALTEVSGDSQKDVLKILEEYTNYGDFEGTEACCLAIDEIKHLREELAYCRAEMKAVWNLVQKVSPWSESNDMNWSDEVGTGIHFLVQERDELRAKIEAAEVYTVSKMPGSAFGLIALEPGMVGKRVRLVVCDD